MYLEHFGLDEPPFKITPATDFFFSGANRGEILDALVYAITSSEGIIKLTGEVGSGKTMLCRMLLERLPPHVETVYLANPSLSREEMLYAIADGLGLNLEGQRVNVILQTLQTLLQQKTHEGKRVVILVDEAHAMPLETLEELRLLYNLQVGDHKLLQIVLFGQPELNSKLDKPNMRQLKDRIVHHFTILPLSKNAIESYLMFRMRAAGYHGPNPFSDSAIKLLVSASHGLLRRINILADKALLAAFVENTHRVEVRHVRAAIRDSELSPRPPRRKHALLLGGAALSILVLLAADWLLHNLPNSPSAAPAAPSAAAAVSNAPPPPAVAATIQPAAKPQTEQPKLPPLLQQRLAAAQTMLAQRTADDANIQLFYSEETSPARMEGFLQRAKQLGKLQEIYVLSLDDPGKTGFRVLYGNYPSVEVARNGIKQLPARYQRAFNTAPYQPEATAPPAGKLGQTP